MNGNYPQTAKLDRNEVRRLYLVEGLSLEEIHVRLGYSRQCLARWMDKWGIKRRTGPDTLRQRWKKEGRARGPNWQGGRWFLQATRTWYVYCPGHPKAKKHNGAFPEHILIAEKELGRFLKTAPHGAGGETVHHKNGDRSDNRLENLYVLSNSEHLKLHRFLGTVGIELINQGKLRLVMGTAKTQDIRTLLHSVYRTGGISADRRNS